MRNLSVLTRPSVEWRWVEAPRSWQARPGPCQHKRQHILHGNTLDDFFEENTIDRTDKYEQVWPHSAAGEIHLIKSEHRPVSFSYMRRSGWSENRFFFSIFFSKRKKTKKRNLRRRKVSRLHNGDVPNNDQVDKRLALAAAASAVVSTFSSPLWVISAH